MLRQTQDFFPQELSLKDICTGDTAQEGISCPDWARADGNSQA